MSFRETWSHTSDRKTFVPLPLDQMIAEDDPVRLFDEVLGNVNWSPWGAGMSVPVMYYREALASGFHPSSLRAMRHDT